ncbi:LOW QUALITY PROTEIN: zinc-binding protein A33-like [Cygnus atratus]|uniref:LOW QUALITY PROTEIN: zinc-binding protein A33-like n=1 Tax=Cygnus atratus TaxID=8868 RepID=UPI0015D613B5|nr:LOW QUALITY PROTEIN: zinc-binding protein A33-like [Cygnus atratus]
MTKASGELNFKIQAEFTRLHQILEEEERAELAELGEEEEQSLVRLEEGMSALCRDMEHIEQTLSKMEEVSLLEVESLDIRYMPGMNVETVPAFDLQHYRDSQSGSVHYIFWGQVLQHVCPAPAPLAFDPETAHPRLVFSRGLKAVTEWRQAQPVPRSPQHFQQRINALGSCTSDGGQHYREVWVGGKPRWDLGVAAETVDWVVKVKLCQNGFWTRSLRNRTEYGATVTPWVRLALLKVGVFLDCQEGTAAFFDARDVSQLFTFQQISAERYCPFLSPCCSDGMDSVSLCAL